MFKLFEMGLCNRFFSGSMMHLAISFFAVFAIGYLLGSLNFGIVISSAFYHDDVRRHGSGNAGMTNMLRTYGKLPAAATFAGDVLKTVVAVLVGALFLGSHNTAFYVKDGVIYSSLDKLLKALSQLYGDNIPEHIPGVAAYAGYAGMYIGGLAAIVGHAFPFYYKFKGGKSIAATFSMVLMTEPLAALICLMFFVAIVAATKYISLGSIMSAIVYPLVLYRLAGPGMHNIIAIFIMLFVVFLHRANIKKLLNGTENKLDLRSRKKKKDSV